MTQRTVWRVTLIIGAAAMIFGSGWLVDVKPTQVGTVRLGVSSSLPSAPLWIAEAQGFFAQAGLSVSLTEYASGKAGVEALLKQEVDLAPAAEFKAVQVALSNTSLRILGTTAFMHTTQLLGLKARGVNSAADLKGKRVGLRMGTNSEYFLARLLVLHGLTRTDVEWVDVNPNAMAAALDSGSVDAVLVWSPYTRQIKTQLGERLSESDGQPGQDYYYLLLGLQTWLAHNALIAERVMQALLWAEAWMQAHPEETRAFLAAKYGLPVAELEADLQHSRFSISLPQALLTALESEATWLIQQGSASHITLNSLELIAFEPLRTLAPEAVTIIPGSP